VNDQHSTQRVWESAQAQPHQSRLAEMGNPPLHRTISRVTPPASDLALPSLLQRAERARAYYAHTIRCSPCDLKQPFELTELQFYEGAASYTQGFSSPLKLEPPRHHATLSADRPEPPILSPVGSWLARRLQFSTAAAAVLAGLAHALDHGSKSQGFCLVADEQTIGESWIFFFEC
jgi:hypothetical protein